MFYEKKMHSILLLPPSKLFNIIDALVKGSFKSNKFLFALEFKATKTFSCEIAAFLIPTSILGMLVVWYLQVSARIKPFYIFVIAFCHARRWRYLVTLR